VFKWQQFKRKITDCTLSELVSSVYKRLFADLAKSAFPLYVQSQIIYMMVHNLYDGTWQQIIRNKYLGTKPLSQVQRKSGDSHFWASLMKVKRDFLKFEPS